MTISSQIDILMVWYQNDGGFFGRRNERIAYYLSAFPMVRKVMHLEPPLHIGDLACSLMRQLRHPDPHTRHRLREDLTRLLSRNTAEPIIRRTPWLPIPQTRFAGGSLMAWNRQWAVHQVKRWASRLGIRDPLLWFYPPCVFAEWVAEVFPTSRIICDCVDAVPAVSWLSVSQKDRFQESYRRLLGRAETVFAVSEETARSLKPYRSDIIVIPNGVDMPGPAKDREPKRSPSPLLGYIGTIDERLDEDLILRLLAGRPGWTLTLVGPVQKERQTFWKEQARRFPNLRLAGPVPWQESDACLSALDAALLPHRVTPYTRSMDPLKVYRYLAAGKPVVSTPVIDPQRFEGLPAIANAHEFIPAVEEALRTDSPRRAWERREAMRAHSWERRVWEMMRCLGFAGS